MIFPEKRQPRQVLPGPGNAFQEGRSKTSYCSILEQYEQEFALRSSSEMEQAVPNVVGPSIRKKRYALAMTQEMLAARCSVLGCEITRSTLAKIESQVRGINDMELFTIAKALKVPMESLFPKGFL